MTCDDAKSLLNPSLDGELDAVRRAALYSHVETCHSCAEDLARLERVSSAVRSSMPRYHAPEHLRANIRLALRGAEYLDRRRGFNWKTNWNTWGLAAAAGVAIVALASAPFLVNARDRRRAFAEELLSAHQRALAGREVDVASTDQHTVKPWFNGKLPFSPPVTDLASEGFPLEGGRVDYAGGRPIAALVYRRRLHRIDVFVRPADEQPAPVHFDRNGFHEISWKKNGFSFTCVSDLNVEELTRFARLLEGS